MKKNNLTTIIAVLLELCGAVFLILSVFTDINDDVFLPIALASVLGANSLLLFINSKKLKRKNSAKEE